MSNLMSYERAQGNFNRAGLGLPFLSFPLLDLTSPTPQSKERSNGEYKVCLNEKAILRLLDESTWQNEATLRAFVRGSCATGKELAGRAIHECSKRHLFFKVLLVKYIFVADIITASHQPAFGLPHRARQDQHLCTPCLLDQGKNVPITSV